MIIKIIKVLLINITVLFACLIPIELYFGSWLYESKNYKSLLIPKQKTDLLDHLPYEFDNIGIFTRDKNGFRANNYDLKDIDILVIGGSTTEERDIDDNLIWTKIFEKNLKKKLKVLNAGIGGQTSYGHMLMFDIWFSKYENLKPKYVLVYLGINDALYLIESLEKNTSKGRELNSTNRDLLIDLNFYDKAIQYFKNNSALRSLYLVVKGNLISRKFKINYNNEPKFFSISQTNKPENLHKLDQEKFKIFRKYYYKNLDNILQLKYAFNSQVILITQTVSKQHWLYPYVKIINTFTLDFCKLNNIICFDITKDDKFSQTENFYDGIHTNPKASELLGIKIADEFNNNLK